MNISNHLEEEVNYAAALQPLPLQTEETAVQERVTAQEIAQALASLEAQREHAERALHNTVPIGQALEQLGLTASAAEILAEVQVQRQRQAQKQQVALQRTHVQRRGFPLALALTGAFVLFLSGFTLLAVRQAPVSVQDMQPAIMSPQPTPVAAEIHAPVAAEIQTLAEVPEGQLIQCKSQDFTALLQNPSLAPSQVLVQTLGSSSAMGNWTLIKHGGHVYVRGYMAAMSPQAMAQMKTVQIWSSGYDSSQAGGMAYVKPVTVRLGSFAWKGMSSEGGIPNITVTNLHLDPYADALR